MGYSNTYTTERVKTHAELLAIVATARDKKSKPLQNNTRAELRGDDVAIKLHDTDVITVNTSNVYTLNSGGWRTATTKDRINAHSPAKISQKAGIWYMSDNSLFYDGIQVNAAGKIIKPKSTEESNK